MKIVYVDMDSVLVDFQSGIDALTDDERAAFKDDLDDVPGIFSKMKPVDGAIEAYKELTEYFDVYILSTAPWNNPSAWTDKLLWVKKYLGDLAHKRLILSHNKNLNFGDYLIDDNTANGAGEFKGEHIHFLGDEFKNWNDVLNYLIPHEENDWSDDDWIDEKIDYDEGEYDSRHYAEEPEYKSIHDAHSLEWNEEDEEWSNDDDYR